MPQGLMDNPMLLMAMNMMANSGPSRTPQSLGQNVGQAGLSTMQQMMQRKMMEKEMERADKEMELKNKRMKILTDQIERQNKLSEAMANAQFDTSTDSGRYGMSQALMQMGGQYQDSGLFNTGAQMGLSESQRGRIPNYKVVKDGDRILGVADESGFHGVAADPWGGLLGGGPTPPAQTPPMAGAQNPANQPGVMSSVANNLKSMVGMNPSPYTSQGLQMPGDPQQQPNPFWKDPSYMKMLKQKAQKGETWAINELTAAGQSVY